VLHLLVFSVLSGEFVALDDATAYWFPPLVKQSGDLDAPPNQVERERLVTVSDFECREGQSSQARGD